MALIFDLVQALNRNGQFGNAIAANNAVFGAFSLGTYTGGGHNHNTFQVFDRYRYLNTATYNFPDIFDTNTELGWMGPDGYPHVGIENINNNNEIRPNLWGESVYFHPGPTGPGNWADSASRPCVIRFTAPYNGTLDNGVGNFIKGSETFNVKAGWTILKNGVPINPRIVANQGEIIPISLGLTNVVVGDFIDFVVDIDDDGATSDDSAITFSVELQLAVTPTPIPNPNPINCTDTVVSGTIELAQSGTVSVYAPNGTTLLGTGTITPIVGTVNGQWSVTGLNLNSYGGQSLQITALDSPSTVSAAAIKAVGNSGCVVCVPPTITTQPIPVTVCSGNLPHTFSVVVAGDTPTYQWRLNGVDIPGANASTYDATSAGNYSVFISNACGNITSNIVALTVTDSPTIVSGASLPDVSSGTAYSHTITLSGTQPFSLGSVSKPSWLTITVSTNTIVFSGTPGGSDVGSNIPISFNIDNVCASVVFGDTIDVISGCVAVGAGTITGPSEVAAFVPNTYSVSGLTGTGPFTYFWSVPASGSIISGQGTSSISTQFSNLGVVSVDITNCGGTFNRTINFPVSIFTGNAVDDVIVTSVNTPVVIDLSANDISC